MNREEQFKALKDKLYLFHRDAKEVYKALRSYCKDSIDLDKDFIPFEESAKFTCLYSLGGKLEDLIDFLDDDNIEPFDERDGSRKMEMTKEEQFEILKDQLEVLKREARKSLKLLETYCNNSIDYNSDYLPPDEVVNMTSIFVFREKLNSVITFFEGDDIEPFNKQTWIKKD